MAEDRDGAPCVCGGVIPRDRRDGFCSSWCAGRDAQGLPPAVPPPLRPPLTAGAGVTVAAVAAAGSAAGGEEEPKRPSYRLRRRKIADEVEDRLRDAALLDTWQAAQVLDLADSLDWSGGSLSARATAHRELERQMSELLRGRDEAGSRVGGMRDELEARRARRAARRAGGGGA